MGIVYRPDGVVVCETDLDELPAARSARDVKQHIEDKTGICACKQKLLTQDALVLDDGTAIACNQDEFVLTLIRNDLFVDEDQGQVSSISSGDSTVMAFVPCVCTRLGSKTSGRW